LTKEQLMAAQTRKHAALNSDDYLTKWFALQTKVALNGREEMIPEPEAEAVTPGDASDDDGAF
jgi:hypothetical protein